MSVDQVGSKDSDTIILASRIAGIRCPLIRLVPRTATLQSRSRREPNNGCPLIRLVPRTATKMVGIDVNQTQECPLIRLVPRTATAFRLEEALHIGVSVDQVGSKDSDKKPARQFTDAQMCPLIRLVPRTATS